MEAQMKGKLLFPLFILLASAAWVPGAPRGTAQKENVPVQQSPPAKEQVKARKEDDVVRISVTLVQIDAVVTDQHGKQMTDLKAEDFELFEDNRRQQITNFSYVTAQPAGEASATPSTRTNPSAPPGPLMPPVRLRVDQVRRTIALVVDDLGMSFESISAVRDSLKKFVDEQMQPGDLVAIIRTGAGIGALQQFTADRRQLYAAIERIRWYPSGRSSIGAFAPIESQAPDSRAQETNDELNQFREDAFSVG